MSVKPDASTPATKETMPDPPTLQSGRPLNVNRLMLGIVLVAGFAELASVVVNISAMPVYIRARGLPEFWVGAVATCYLIVEGSLKAPLGILGDRVGRKTLIMLGPAISIFTALATPHISNPYGLISLRVLDGIGAAALWPAAFSLIGDCVPARARARAMSLFNLAYILGVAFGPALGGTANEYVYHHWLRAVINPQLRLLLSKGASFYLAAGLYVITVVVTAFALPGKRAVSVSHGRDHTAPSPKFSLADFIGIVRRMPTMLALAFVTFAGIGLISAYMKLFAQDHFGLTESEFGRLLIIPALIIASLSVPLGSMGDRIGKSIAVRIGMGLCALAMWGLVLVPIREALVVMGTLLGLGFIVAFPAWMALVTESCEPNQRGATVGAVSTAQGIGAIAGTALSAVLYHGVTMKWVHWSTRLVMPPGGRHLVRKIVWSPYTLKHFMPDVPINFYASAVMLTLAFLIALFFMRDTPHPEKPSAEATS